jgi:hypothetical protein
MACVSPLRIKHTSPLITLYMWLRTAYLIHTYAFPSLPYLTLEIHTWKVAEPTSEVYYQFTRRWYSYFYSVRLWHSKLRMAIRACIQRLAYRFQFLFKKLLLFSTYAPQPSRLIVRSPSVSTRVTTREHPAAEVERKFCPNTDFHVTFRDLLHAIKLRLPLRRKVCWGFFRPKNPTASAGCEPANLGTRGQHSTSRPRKPLSYNYTALFEFMTIVTGKNTVKIVSNMNLSPFEMRKLPAVCQGECKPWGTVAVQEIPTCLGYIQTQHRICQLKIMYGISLRTGDWQTI